MSPSSCLGVPLLLVAALHADFLPQTFPVLAPDSSEVRRIYGANLLSNASSRTQVRVLEAGVLRLEADTILSEDSTGYSAQVGLVLPLHRDRVPLDLTGMSALSLDLRFDAVPAGGIVIAWESSVYGEAHGKAPSHQVLLVPAVLPVPGTWKRFHIPIEDFLQPAWTSRDSFHRELDQVLRQVEAIRIEPNVSYAKGGSRDGSPCERCVSPTQPEMVVELRDLVVVGISHPVPPLSLDSCESYGTGELLDDFMDGDSTNAFGGSWSVASDTSSDPSRADDSGRGSSEVHLEIQGGDEYGAGFARVRANLLKQVGQPPQWRPYAGWASLSMDFEGQGVLELPWEYRLSFQMRLMRPGVSTPGILFKLKNPRIRTDLSHQVLIPAALVDPASPSFRNRICIDPRNFRQPSWVRSPVPFDPYRIERLVWEARIADRIDPRIVQDSVEFLLADVRVHCPDCTGANRSRRPPKSFSVAYAGGRLTARPPAGYEQISVVSPSGRVAARCTGKVQDKPLTLERGTWVVVARNAKGESLVRTIAVPR